MPRVPGDLWRTALSLHSLWQGLGSPLQLSQIPQPWFWSWQSLSQAFISAMGLLLNCPSHRTTALPDPSATSITTLLMTVPICPIELHLPSSHCLQIHLWMQDLNPAVLLEACPQPSHSLLSPSPRSVRPNLNLSAVWGYPCSNITSQCMKVSPVLVHLPSPLPVGDIWIEMIFHWVVTLHMLYSFYVCDLTRNNYS